MFDERFSILIIDDNSSFVLSLLRSFSDFKNTQIYVLLSSNKKPGYFRYSKYLKKIYPIQITEDNFSNTIKDVVEKTSADFIIPTREWISKLLWKNRSVLEQFVKIHPVSDADIIETVNDKRKLNNWLKTNNFPSSNIVLFNNGNTTDSFINKLSFPVLLKPAINLGGIGIKLINSSEQLTSVITAKAVHEKDYFLQEYINGYDIGVNIFSINGKILCHTIQKALFNGQLTYSRATEFVRNPDLYDLVSSIIEKLKYTGVANLDFRYDILKNKYVLLDFNARYWSTLEGSRFMGINFPALVTTYSLGHQINSSGYSTGTYYCTKAALKTLIKNFFTKNKLPINLRHTKLAVIAKDPLPEIIHSGEVFKDFIKIKTERIRQSFNNRLSAHKFSNGDKS